MHLRSIKLRGFKSFPDPVEVKLERGVAVVVGPNGSGKSNVSDAIVWAAGSLTPSELRADKPDDVLFNGSQKRQPADHCEVELLFDNTEGTFADLDFSEISIARRLVRGGEGQYLVNRTPVRRTDLTELLADVGLGKSMHSIVSQGKVGQVLASRPDERRELIEEAAGLGKFKQRKHRAELKLTRVGIQVDRAKDVEEEVKKRLRPLALQATAAERAEKLAVEIAGLRLRVAQLDLASVAERKAAADERKQAATMARRSAHEKLTGLLAEREQAEEELSDAAGKREAALGALYRLQGAAERLAIRRESAAGLQARLAGELREVERELAERSDEAMRALEQASLSAAGAARDAAQASGQAAERARLAHAQVAAAERMIAQAAEARLEELRGERERVERALSEAVGGQEAANKRLRALGASRERLTARKENIGGLLGRLREELASARAIAARGGPSPAELEQAANDAAQLARATATERDDLAERARAARDRLAALERAIAEREGIPPAARALAAEGERLVLSALEVDPGNERAVTAALGWRASALLAADPEAGLALLRRAHDAGLGSLSVVAGRDPAELVAALPVVPLDALLDATTASVTAEGFGFDPDRGELWFAGETAEAVLLEMDARRRSLVDESEELTARAASAAKAAEDAAAQAKVAEAAFAEVAHLRDRFVDPDALERLVAVAGTAEKAIERAASCVARIEGPIAAGVTAGSDASATLGPELRRLADLEGTARRDAAEAARRAQTAEVVVARLGGAVEGVNVAPDVDLQALAAEASSLLAASEAAARAAREAADRARAAESMLLERAPRKVAADPDLLGRLVSFTGEVGGLLESAAVLADRLQAPVRARVDAGSQRSTELGATLRRLGAEEVQLRAAVDEATERVTKVEVEIARLDGEGAEAQRRLDEAGTEEPAEGDDRAELHARAERLEQRRQSLGMVNPLAKEEYEAEKVRLEELSAQREDLEASLRELEKLRDELAETVKRRFDDTFAAVAENFQEVAETLFPGGAGRLRLVESDEEGVEPGVEVELSPAGKKITKLSLLSGGEKALGAISFLFALFLAKPCPFYLLDEVEAALDDANVGRFVELLRRYADRAQFVVITHQKRTMEAADVLYGVTMGGDGVSQIVSRRLPRHESVAAGAAAS